MINCQFASLERNLHRCSLHPEVMNAVLDTCWLVMYKYKVQSVQNNMCNRVLRWTREVLERDTDHHSALQRQWPAAFAPSLRSLIRIRRQTQQSQVDTHMYKCRPAKHTHTHTPHTHSWILIGWPKAIDIICYGVRPRSHPERPAASASHTASEEEEDWRSEGRRKGKEKTNRRQTGLRRKERSRGGKNTTTTTATAATTKTQSGAEFIN